MAFLCLILDSEGVLRTGGRLEMLALAAGSGSLSIETLEDSLRVFKLQRACLIVC